MERSRMFACVCRYAIWQGCASATNGAQLVHGNSHSYPDAHTKHLLVHTCWTLYLQPRTTAQRWLSWYNWDATALIIERR